MGDTSIAAAILAKSRKESVLEAVRINSEAVFAFAMKILRL